MSSSVGFSLLQCDGLPVWAFLRCAHNLHGYAWHANLAQRWTASSATLTSFPCLPLVSLFTCCDPVQIRHAPNSQPRFPSCACVLSFHGRHRHSTDVFVQVQSATQYQQSILMIALQRRRITHVFFFQASSDVGLLFSASQQTACQAV